MRVIGRTIPTLLILMIIEVVMMTWFILSPLKTLAVNSFSHWITSVTVTTVTVSTVGILVGVAIYFPTYVCVRLEIILPTHSFN